jgi:Family of unknown function (DUF6193)
VGTTQRGDGAVDPVLYPDIAAAGSLVCALVDLAGRRGIDLGPVEAPPGAREAISAHMSCRRGNIIVYLEPDERTFSVLLGGGGHEWARGETGELLQAARAVEAWRSGVTLRELATRFPFMTYTGLAQAYEDGTQVEYRWNQLLNNPDLETIRPLLTAARADQRLRELSPSVSHGNYVRLALGSWTREYAELHIIQLPDRFQVEASWDMAPRSAQIVADAIGLAVALLASHPDAPSTGDAD